MRLRKNWRSHRENGRLRNIAILSTRKQVSAYGVEGGSAPSSQENWKMQYQVYAVPVRSNGTQVEEMNRFLRSNGF